MHVLFEIEFHDLMLVVDQEWKEFYLRDISYNILNPAKIKTKDYT